MNSPIPLKKRERACNFEKAEIELLTKIVTKFKDAIENKKTNAISNKEKDAAWENIASNFNAAGGISRTAKTLKLKYEGLKKAFKKKSSIHRPSLYGTGDGPSSTASTATDLIDAKQKVMRICTNITRLDPSNESDYIPDTSDKTPKRQSWNPKALKRNIAPFSRKTPTKGSVTAKIDLLTAARLELVQLQMEMTKKEMEFKKEEHQIRVAYLHCDENRKEELHKLKRKKIQQSSED